MLLLASLLVTLSLLTLQLPALAQTTVPTPGETPAPMVIESDDAGNVVIRGEVTSVDSDSMTIDSWGGSWTIRTTGNSVVAASVDGTESSTDNFDQISVGNFVGVEGIFSTDEEMTIDASFVRDWTTDPLPGVFDTLPDSDLEVDTEADVEADDIETDVDQSAMITYSGSVDQVDDVSFTFTDDFNSTYNVTVDDSVAVVNSDGEIMSLTDIDVGDTVELDGIASGGAITTAMVRITSE